jgi:DNA polymerase elongation subunit (family B)
MTMNSRTSRKASKGRLHDSTTCNWQKRCVFNSAYGAMGNQYFRFFDIRIAEAITLAGQLSIRWIELRINEYMNKLLKTENVDYVVASDTDSIYLTLDTIVRRSFGDRVGSTHPAKIITFLDKVCETKIQPFIDEVYQDLASYMNAYAQKMQMKREALADRGIWTAKKRYIMNVYNNEGVQYAKPKLKVMGLEMIKSSTPAAIREKMKDAIEIILRGSESDVQNFIEKFKDEFKSLPPEEISFPRGVSGMKEYADAGNIYKKGTPIHVKGALLYNNLLLKHKLTKKYPKIQEGEKLRFTYLRLPNVINDTVISYPGRLPSEFDLHRFVDYDLQFDKAFIEPLKAILDCVGWKAYQESDLTSFFS